MRKCPGNPAKHFPGGSAVALLAGAGDPRGELSKVESMIDLIRTLARRAQRGSKPRCHLMTHGTPEEIAGWLAACATPFATVSPEDRWMPVGFEDPREAQLHRAPRLLNRSVSVRLESWWLASANQKTRTPNFDIASTCKVDGVPGLLLVEAKAHEDELLHEASGKLLRRNRRRSEKVEGDGDIPDPNHVRIGAAIEEARAGLEQMTSLPWSISRDTCYQMSNRFAWAWKLTQLGIPVVLVYLGFLRAADMSKPFDDDAAWERLVKAQSQALFPPQVWGQRWGAGANTLVPLIRSMELHNELWA